MNKQEIIEGNKLIAIFDGWRFCNDDTETYPNGYWILPTDYGNQINDGDFLYHENWDWLMPVVEKISEVCEKNQEKYYAYWNQDETHDIRIFRESKEVTWQAVVSFIKFYNQQNNS